MSAKKSTVTSFEDSELFDFDKFRSELSDWPEDKVRYFYEQAQDYSAAKGAKYANWARAVAMWDRRSPEQWERARARARKSQPIAMATRPDVAGEASVLSGVQILEEQKPDARDLERLRSLRSSRQQQ